MARERITAREQEEALAKWLWERGPLTAVYKGEMADKVAKILGKQLDYSSPPQRATGTRVIQGMRDRGLVETVGTTQLPIRLTYVGPDPATIEWMMPTLHLAPVPEDTRLAEMGERLLAVEVKLARLLESLGEVES
jgi:hypothetical protein